MATSSELHVFEMVAGCDWVVAADEDDAWVVWCEHTGEQREDYERDGGFVAVPEDQMMIIMSDPPLSGETEPLTAGEHAQASGRGFLCSTEW
jgi:hypothetical protein